jgi:hypothetical protein
MQGGAERAQRCRRIAVTSRLGTGALLLLERGCRRAASKMSSTARQSSPRGELIRETRIAAAGIEEGRGVESIRDRRL